MADQVNTKRFEIWLREAIECAAEIPVELAIRRIETFDGVGMLTHDRGLLVSFKNGAEIQVTLVMTQRGRDAHDGDEDDGDDEE